MTCPPGIGRACGIAAILVGASTTPWGATAQTTVNPGALDLLSPAPTTAVPVPSAPVAKKPARAAAPGRSPSKPDARAALPKAPNAKPVGPKPPAVAAAPPPAPVLPPPIVVPTRPAPPPPPVAISAEAPGEIFARPDGLRLGFGAGRSDMNPATDAALRALAHQSSPLAQASYTVTAYAAGSADDPSTPRRLSLARALAVRAVLITEGVASARITVRALGAPVAADEPQDRVDVVLAGTPPASTSAADPGRPP